MTLGAPLAEAEMSKENMKEKSMEAMRGAIVAKLVMVAKSKENKPLTISTKPSMS